MREYGKLQVSFWTSDDIRSLSDDARMLAAYLLTGPHTTMIGCFRLPDGYVTDDLGWSLQRVSKGFAELLAKGFATRCEQSKWVVIHRFLKWNRIENPNQGKAALQCFEQIPAGSAVKALAAKAICDFGRHVDLSEIEPFLKGSETVTQTLSKSGTGTGTGEEDKAPRSATSPPVDAVVCIPLNDGTEFPITQAQVTEFTALYPAVDVLAELRACRGWNLANAKHRKTRGGVLKHVNGWLARQQNDSRRSRGAPPAAGESPFEGAIREA